MAVLFISETTIKETTVLNENVDPKLIAPAIIESQDIHIQPILGSNLYTQISGMIGDLSISSPSNSAFKALLDNYIQQALKYYVLAELVTPMTIKMNNKTVATRSSENAQPIAIEDMALVREEFKNKAEWYGQRLINYLRDNTNTFPKYLEAVSGFTTILPKRSSYTGGMYLGEGEGINGYNLPNRTT